MPLSLNENSHCSPSLCADTEMRGGWSAANFSALLSRFWKTAVSSEVSPSTTGRWPASIVACEALTAGPRFAQAWASRMEQETSSRRWAVRPTRLNASRSLISCCMRLAPSTASSMYWSAFSSSRPA
jgi:hypothetical protein